MTPTIRLLDPSEHALLLTGHPALDGHPLPPLADIFVAEADGAIVGLWAIVPTIHLEPVWLAPEAQRGSTGYRLFQAVSSHLDNVGLRAAYCFAASPEVADYLARLGLTFQPYATFLYESPCPKPSSPLPPPPQAVGSLADPIAPNET